MSSTTSHEPTTPVPSIIEAIAGFSSGIISTLVSHPLDVIKTRLQVNRTSTRLHVGNSFSIARDIVRHEGGNIQALYRGLTPNLVGNSISWSIYFVCYDYLKTQLSNYHGDHGHAGYTREPRHNALQTRDYFLASGLAGCITALCTNPIWVIKTRMLSSGGNTPGAYTGMIQGWSEIVRGKEGVSGLYRGLIPSLFGVSHGAVQFALYELLKQTNRSRKKEEGDEKPSNASTVLFSTLSKTVAVGLTYPYQVIRARLQTYDAANTYTSARDVVVQSWRREGPLGFYKGLTPTLLRIIPTTCVTFLTYENCRFYLPVLLGEENSS